MYQAKRGISSPKWNSINWNIRRKLPIKNIEIHHLPKGK